MYLQYIILSLFFICSHIQATVTLSSDDATTQTSHLVGTLPDKISRIIAYLTRINNAEQTREKRTKTPVFKNRFILYGPPGNGKSTLAHTIATLSHSEFIRLDGPSIVGSYVGQGANAVKETFEKAYAIADTSDRCVVIFIDEIDAIAVNNTSEFRGEHQAALQQLWLELDHCKHNPKIFVILATNYFNRLNKTFLDRFGSNMLEVKNPDEAHRSKILEFYAHAYHITLSASLISTLAAKSNGLSIRSLEDLICDLALTHADQDERSIEREALHLLALIRKKFDENISDTKDGNESELQKWSLRIGIVSGVLSGSLTLYHLGTLLYPTIVNFGVKLGVLHHQNIIPQP